MKILIAVVMVAVAGGVLRGQNVSHGTLTVRLVGFTHARGTARIALTDARTFLTGKAPLRGDSVAIRDGAATGIFRDVPFGSYALQAYHDENGNSRLDRNLLGIPSEPYGFSNDARSAMRAPTYDEAEFTLKVAAMTIEIRVR